MWGVHRSIGETPSHVAAKLWRRVKGALAQRGFPGLQSAHVGVGEEGVVVRSACPLRR